MAINMSIFCKQTAANITTTTSESHFNSSSWLGEVNITKQIPEVIATVNSSTHIKMIDATTEFWE